MPSLCPTGKIRHSNKEGAENAVRHMKANGRDVRTLKPYKCWHCGYWHIGHADAATRAKFRS